MDIVTAELKAFLANSSELTNLIHLGLAFLISTPVAWNREHSRTGAAGLRTFPIVCMASCAFALMGQLAFENGDAQARVIYGVMTGIGFIGGGAILKQGFEVAGTATAASIWNMAAVGVAVAYNYFDIAIMLALTNFLLLRFFTPLRNRPENASDSDSNEE